MATTITADSKYVTEKIDGIEVVIKGVETHINNEDLCEIGCFTLMGMVYSRNV